mmetsp:Transcript_30552/g.55382  ORF Transcript_30552/g.55382 Transcript_30552/m.55382 type:complete len:260 (-) Transcript_30552:89-868(-)
MLVGLGKQAVEMVQLANVASDSTEFCHEASNTLVSFQERVVGVLEKSLGSVTKDSGEVAISITLCAIDVIGQSLLRIAECGPWENRAGQLWPDSGLVEDDLLCAESSDFSRSLTVKRGQLLRLDAISKSEGLVRATGAASEGRSGVKTCARGLVEKLVGKQMRCILEGLSDCSPELAKALPKIRAISVELRPESSNLVSAVVVGELHLQAGIQVWKARAVLGKAGEWSWEGWHPRQLTLRVCQQLFNVMLWKAFAAKVT